MTTTTTEIDVVLMLVVLGLAAVGALAAQLARAAQPVRPPLPRDDRPPAGLSRLVPVGRQIDSEFGAGLAQLETWLISARRPRP